MEKYVGSCRLILCCNSTSRVIPAIRSRCLAVRVAAPTIDEVRRTNERSRRKLFVDLDRRNFEKSRYARRRDVTSRFGSTHRREESPKSSSSSADAADLRHTEVEMTEGKSNVFLSLQSSVDQRSTNFGTGLGDLFTRHGANDRRAADASPVRRSIEHVTLHVFVLRQEFSKLESVSTN